MPYVLARNSARACSPRGAAPRARAVAVAIGSFRAPAGSELLQRPGATWAPAAWSGRRHRRAGTVVRPCWWMAQSAELAPRSPRGEGYVRPGRVVPPVAWSRPPLRAVPQAGSVASGRPRFLLSAVIVPGAFASAALARRSVSTAPAASLHHDALAAGFPAAYASQSACRMAASRRFSPLRTPLSIRTITVRSHVLRVFR